VIEIALKANAAGQVRLVKRPVPGRKQAEGAAAQLSLVRSAELQDSIRTGYAAMKSGFGWQPDGKRFTKCAKRTLQEFGSIIDSSSLTRCVFLTGTLPGSTPEALQAVARWSGWIVSRLGQWLRDRWRSISFFGVWEYQRRGALHLHLVVQCADALESQQLKSVWKKRWASLLDGVSKRSQVDVWSRKEGDTWDKKRWVLRTDAQTVEKSVGRYLSKYVSKSLSKLSIGSVFPPSSWWFASRNLRTLASSLRWEYRLSTDSREDAQCVYEDVSAQLAASAIRVFPMTNKWDIRYTGVIALVPPSVAGLMFRHLSGALRAAECMVEASANSIRTNGRVLAGMFDGRLLTNS
jgi:hypothetical protein